MNTLRICFPALAVLISTALCQVAQGGAAAPTAEVRISLKPTYVSDQGDTYIGHWGRYTIRASSGQEFGGKVTVFDQHHRVVRRITGFSFVDSIEAENLGTGNVLDIQTGGNTADEYMQDVRIEQTARGLHTDLVLSGGVAEPIGETVNGRPLLLSPWSETQAWTEDFLGHGGQPYDIPLVLEWNGRRYVFATSRHPHFSRIEARDALYELIAAIHANYNEEGYDNEGVYRYWTALYYGNMLEINEGAYAHRWLFRHLPASMKPWFRQYAPGARSRERHSCVTATASQRKTIVFQNMEQEGRFIMQ